MEQNTHKKHLRKLNIHPLKTKMKPENIPQKEKEKHRPKLPTFCGGSKC